MPNGFREQIRHSLLLLAELFNECLLRFTAERPGRLVIETQELSLPLA
jgi:hypothetical protein